MKIGETCRGGFSNTDSDRQKRYGIMARKKHTFQVLVEQDEEGWYVAECPALKGCYTQGKTYEEVMDNIRDVIELCLEELRASGQSVPTQPEIISVRRVEVVI
ncbi:Predicted nuclease of the RNAse H fold, HicB family [Planctomicrobium piriforme]|uniref:Predicted nuclease of the RNAse H fold, HicB family n=2 Tax=Planctomicrobium piriforme TaxID=1576369 RepID=A0A1I3HHD0_9PLAN|nr:Predicted nuclease of the RNAse H fold, HicB family [Planctomicrobium piriforme]